MKVNTAKFVISNSKVEKCLHHDLPEYAFIGRSNVGKSSLINMLTNHKNLAKTSGKPGKTQLINHFIINDSWYLVDLPGYGFAKVPKYQRNAFEKFIEEYFLTRKELICTFLLIDIRHKPQNIDLNFMEFLGSSGVPFSIVFTKADKLKPLQTRKSLDFYKKTMLNGVWQELPDMFITSSENAVGKQELLDHLEKLNINSKNGI
ncbi:MAG: YihA family ribosome biogenesis GTP-binding protein [Flavobacteriaceae bacterium]|nr:YihA family ribosome biogenesis GTP-binding protein [Flavobacteriaceae bacterium]